MEIAALIVSALSLVCAVIVLIRLPHSAQSSDMAEMLSAGQKSIGDMQARRMEDMKRTLNEMNTQLDNRLGAVYRSMGEMQEAAKSVSELKKLFANVKSRGIVGEAQLGAILSDILAPEQYTENIATVPGSRNAVEFAIRMPDPDGAVTYMPIDSKFPADAYAALLDAREDGDKNSETAAKRQLRQRLLSEAKDIHEKYIFPPYTTDFGIMFLPSEGLYAEAINLGIIDELQSTYKITAAGPGTLAALLSAVRMGFKTLAVQQRTAEVRELLGAVKTEISKFNTTLEAARKKLAQADKELDTLVGTRTRAIMRRLRSVEELENYNLEED